MSIKWNLPANIFTTQKFVYTAPAVQQYSNPFAAGLFNMANTGTYTLPNFPIFTPNIPLFNFGKINFSKPVTNFSKGINISNNKQNLSLWKNLGYNSQKGLQLAQTAASNAVGFTGYCAKHVKKAIAKTGLGAYESGNACDMTNILRRNKNFKEISPNGVDLKKLPAGCVLVYGKGVAGYSSKYGHTEITTGSGKAISDGVTNNLYKKPTAIFMPVMA